MAAGATHTASRARLAVGSGDIAGVLHSPILTESGAVIDLATKALRAGLARGAGAGAVEALRAALV